MALSQLSDLERRALAGLVRKHGVYFDVFPATDMVAGQRMTIGYDVEILGAHEAGTRDVLPGCARCEAVWEDLRRVGDAVIPGDLARASTWRVEPFDRALHTRGGGRRDDVRLVVEIRHRREELAPIDRCEERCLHEMTADLRALGARQGGRSG